VCGQLQQEGPCARHADRLAKGQCVLCGIAVCEECNRSASHYACALHHEIPVFEGWAQIYTTNADLDAQLIRENLQAEGIDAEVLSQRDQTFPVDMGELAPVRVLVPAFDYLAAEEILAGHMDPSGEVSFACAACGEAFDPGQEVCASCQAALPQTSA
jgi:hypothetical protein